MKVSEVLNLTADKIERDGWSKGNGWESEPGEPTCVEGAMKAVLGVGGRTGSRLRACPAYVAMQRYLDTPTGLWIWNDWLPYKPGGGWVGGSEKAAVAAAAAEVVEALRACAVIEQARETDGRLIHGPIIEPVREAVA